MISIDFDLHKTKQNIAAIFLRISFTNPFSPFSTLLGWMRSARVSLFSIQTAAQQ